MSINFKKGDLFTLEQQLVDDNASPISFIGVHQVMFVMRHDAEDLTVRGECSFDALTSYVYYQFVDGETDVAGMYRAEYELIYSPLGEETCRVLTVPNRGTLWIHIEDDVA